MIETLFKFKRRVAGAAILVLFNTIGPAAAQEKGFINEYPTSVRADYVFGCMSVNGQTREALERCSCSIDLIASLITYDEYVSAETVLMVAQKGGENTSIFRTSPLMQSKVDTLRRAQAEAEVRCF
jgi:hypothetical protein